MGFCGEQRFTESRKGTTSTKTNKNIFVEVKYGQNYIMVISL